ncbi:MAG TPA: DHA2 family efflux MFS transporter permease subunit [Micromonosporaceae bacterium]
MITATNRRWWALAALVLSLLTIGLDATILNVALPTIATELSAGIDGLQWLVNSYVLVFAGLLLPAGALGDRYGRKRLMLAGLALFGAASLVAALFDSVGPVIWARAAMGIGAAVITPIVLAVLPILFSPEERGRAISFAMMGMGVGIPLGPIVGGYLLEHFWWGSIFLVNVPVAIVGMIAIGLLLPESRDPAPRGADLPGGVLSTLGLVAFVYGLVEAPGRGWGHPIVLSALAAAGVLLVAFVRWELRTPEPMIDLRLFRRSPFRWGTVAATLATFALFGLLFVVPQYLQLVLGFDALGTGIRLLPMIAGLILGAASGERVAARTGHRIPVALGLLAVGAGLGIGATTELHTGYGFAAWWFAIVGLGIGLALAPAMDAVLGALPPERSGSGTAITMTLRQAAGALGVALLGSLLAEVYADRVAVATLPAPAADGARDSIAGALAIATRLGDAALASSAREAYVGGMDVVLAACAGIAVLGAVLSFAFLPGRGVDKINTPDRVDPVDREESSHDLSRTA